MHEFLVETYLRIGSDKGRWFIEYVHILKPMYTIIIISSS